MSLLRLYTLDSERRVTEDFPLVFSWTLEMLLSISPDDVKMVEDSVELLAMRPKGDAGEVYVMTPLGKHFDETASWG